MLSAMQVQLPKGMQKKSDEVKAFRKTLTPETDRGCALMAAAYLDSQIELLLRRLFIADPKKADELLGRSKPLASFSARIDLLFLLGHIGEGAWHDLHLIRKIRNDFGHVSSPIDFTHPPVAARCRELCYSFLEKNVAPRKRFTNAAMGVLGVIHAVLHLCSQPKKKVDTEVRFTPEAIEHLRSELLDDAKKKSQ